MAAIKSTIRGIASTPAGRLLRDATIEISAIVPVDPGAHPAIAFVPDADTELLSPATVHSNNDGSWSTPLFGTTDILPTGTVYRARVKRGKTTYQTIYFDLPGGGASYWIGDRIVGAPSPGPGRTLATIVITPPSATVEAGSTTTVRAIGHYSDSTTADITSSCTWVSSDPTTATVSNTAPTKGVATGVDDGGCTVTATDPVTSIEGVGGLAVTDPPVADPPLIGGGQVQYTGLTTADVREMIDELGMTQVRATADVNVIAQHGTDANPLNGIDYSMAGKVWPILYALDQGLPVLLCITYTPPWLGLYHQIPQTSGQQDDYATIAAGIVQFFVDAGFGSSSGLITFELLNEPNHGFFNLHPDIATIRSLFRKMITQMRLVDPGCKIWPGGPASAHSRAGQQVAKWDAGTSTADDSISPAQYLDGIFGAGGIVGGTTPNTPYVDGYAIHGYTGAGTPDYNTHENELYHAFRDMPGVGDFAVWGGPNQAGSLGYNYYDDIIQVRDPGTTKLIHQTEGGWYGGGPGLTEEQAAIWMLKGLAWWRDWQVAQKAGIYNIFKTHDDVIYGASGNTEEYLGLKKKNIDGSFTAKPQRDVWKAMVQV